MHELTKRIEEFEKQITTHLFQKKYWYDEINKKVILPYMKEKAEWLKGKPCWDNRDIDQAFDLTEKTFEEKVRDWQKENHNKFASAELFWQALAKATKEIAKEYYQAHPEELGLGNKPPKYVE